MQWHTDIGTSPFAAPPLIADVDGDGSLEVVAVPFSETITVLEGSSGKPLSRSHWPLHNLETTFHASPLQACAVLSEKKNCPDFKEFLAFASFGDQNDHC